GLSDGPITSADLAAKLNLRERWVREWLYAMATAGMITYAGDNKYEILKKTFLIKFSHHLIRFTLSPAQKLLFTDEKGSPFFAVGGADFIQAAVQPHVL